MIIKNKMNILKKLSNSDEKETSLSPDIIEKYSNIFIEYEKGWESFRPKDKHCVAYTIQGRTITISYQEGFNFNLTMEVRDIAEKDFLELIDIIIIAEKHDLLAESNSVSWTSHGPGYSYDYSINGKEASLSTLIKCDNSHISEYLFKRYIYLTDKLTK